MAATKASKEVKVKEAEENDSTILKKTDLIKIVANKHDLTLDESKKILDTILENVTEVRYTFLILTQSGRQNLSHLENRSLLHIYS